MLTPRRTFVTAMFIHTCILLVGQQPYMLADLRPGLSGSNPRAIAMLAGHLYFVATTPEFGYELWRTDGTADGTELVKDIYSGTVGSSIGSAAVVDGLIYFQAQDGIHGTEAWRSDGTSAGTVLIKDINPILNAPFYPNGFTAYDGFVYFKAGEPGTGHELWRTDGTEAGTGIVKDIDPGVSGSDPRYLTELNGKLIFWVDTSLTEGYLWKSDGSETGTDQLYPVSPTSTSLSKFCRIENVAYFNGTDSVHGSELWRTDGTTEGTWMVKDIGPDTLGGGISMLHRLGDGLVFSAWTTATGRELWFSDGTEAGTEMITDLNPGPVNGPYVDQMPEVNGWLYFIAANDPAGILQGIYRTNGSETVLVTAEPIAPQDLTAACAGIFFSARLAEHGRELWFTDGTAVGTYMVSDLNGIDSSSPENLYSMGTGLFYQAAHGLYGPEPWICDCSVVGSQELSRSLPELHISPIPASGPVTMTLPTKAGPWDLVIIDMQGRRVHQRSQVQGSIVINTNGWVDGAYLVRAESGEHALQRRFVLDR